MTEGPTWLPYWDSNLWMFSISKSIRNLIVFPFFTQISSPSIPISRWRHFWLFQMAPPPVYPPVLPSEDFQLTGCPSEHLQYDGSLSQCPNFVRFQNNPEKRLELAQFCHQNNLQPYPLLMHFSCTYRLLRSSTRLPQPNTSTPIFIIKPVLAKKLVIKICPLSCRLHICIAT